MVSFANALFQAARGGLCDLADLSGRLTPPQPYRDLDVLTPAKTAFRNFLAGRFCDKPPVPPPKDLNGGQCPGDPYQISGIRFTRYWGAGVPDTTEPFSFGATGPVSSVVQVVTGSVGNYDVNELRIVDSTGTRDLLAVNVFRVFSPPLPRSVDYTNITITNLANPADDCGTPPPPIPPYDPDDFTFNVDVTYTRDDGLDVTVPVAFVVGVGYIDADLNAHIPINVRLDPTFNANIDNQFQFDIDFNISTGEERLLPPRDTNQPRPLPPVPPNSRPDGYDVDEPTPPTSPDADEPPDTDDTTPKVRVIRAALVTVVDISGSTRIGTLFQDGNPDIGIPNYGYINFLCRAGGVSGGWTPDQAVKNRRCFIPCPWDGGAYEVRGTPQPGIEWVITPVYELIPVGV